jgi:hypothetical protein
VKKQTYLSVFLFILMILLISACTGNSAGLAPLPTYTFTPSLVPSATIEWFPSTATPTPRVVIPNTPTPNLHPNVGRVLFEDSFDSESGWYIYRNSNGSTAYGNGEITLAVAEPGSAVDTINFNRQFSDFFLEITASPSLCRAEDAYGVIFRSSQDGDAYRFLVSCDSQMRLDFLNNFRAVPLQDWTPSGVPAGAPLSVRLGIWAVGDEMRFFINDVYQFSIEDRVWDAGYLGLYARSEGDTPVTVNFSDLVVRSAGASSAISVPAATAEPSPSVTVTAIPLIPTVTIDPNMFNEGG